MTLGEMGERLSSIFCISERSETNLTSRVITVLKDTKMQRKETESTVGNSSNVARVATKALPGR